jgi:hypothetical protein
MREKKRGRGILMDAYQMEAEPNLTGPFPMWKVHIIN